MDTATGTEPEDEGQDEDEDETDAPGSWHKQLPRGGYMRHKARVLGEADIGKWQEQSSLGWVKGQPASQPVSQPGHSKGHGWGLECGRGTGHVGGALFVSSCITVSVTPAPCTLHPPTRPSPWQLLPFSAGIASYFLRHGSGGLPKMSPRVIFNGATSGRNQFSQLLIVLWIIHALAFHFIII